MPSRNVEQMIEGIRAMERGDVETIVALADPDVEFVNPDYALEPGTRHGHDGLRAGLAALLEVFENLCFEIERIVEVEDRVLATGTFRGRGRGSGMELAPAPFAVLATLRDERLIRYEWFADAEEAARAAGVEEA